MIDTHEAAIMLGVTPRRIRALIKAERIPAEKFGRDWLIQAVDLANLQVRPGGRPRKNSLEKTENS